MSKMFVISYTGKVEDIDQGKPLVENDQYRLELFKQWLATQ